MFIIRDATINEQFGYIKAEKAGYIHGSRSVVPSNGTNKVTIMLLEETVVGTVSSGSASIVTATDGSSVSFDGNFVKEDGTAYTGSVNVIMHYLDPTDEDMEDQMPGMLYAQNEDGAERMLQTLGMLAVELRGSSGEDLNLAEGSTSEIKIPVDATLLAFAPTTIPLWYFDEATGYWKEEGEATLQGNIYVGTVSHFSFWNCDIPAEAISLCVNVTNEVGEALDNVEVVITSAVYGSSNGYTNTNGQVCGLIPLNENLVLNIYTPAICGNEAILTQFIGPFNEDSNITLTLSNIPNVIEETVIGDFNNCNGDLITDGYVKISYGNQIYTDIVTDRSFEINLLRCSQNNTFSIFGYDYLNSQTTGNINFTFDTTTTDIGPLSACNTVTQFVQFTIDGEHTVIDFEPTFTYWQLGATVADFPVLLMWAGEDIDGYNNKIWLKGQLYESFVGTYDNRENIFDAGFGDSGFSTLNMISENNNVIYNLTAFGDVGEYIDMNFSGTYENQSGNTHHINGVVHLFRNH